jgi:aryl-alcohol dehydrogenase-like predicted oxidoreductase
VLQLELSLHRATLTALDHSGDLRRTRFEILQQHGWLALHAVTAVQACMAFPLSFSEIDRVVVGANSVNQLEQIISAAADVMSVDFPDLCCEDENLINPACWPQL